jgi:hypothetical protein
MRASLAIVARVSAVALTVAASLPGHLELVHQHAGGDRAHVHGDVEALVAHDLLDEHEHGAGTLPHVHPNPHTAGQHGQIPVAHAGQDGPELRAVTAYHVHGLNPFQQASRTTTPADTSDLSVTSTDASRPHTPPSRPLRAARPRGPPIFLVG